MDAGAEEEFRLFVQARWPALVRTAYLLTGDRGRAEDLVQQVLVKVHRRWIGIAHAESPYAYTRAALANEFASWWRRKRVAESLGDVPISACPSVRSRARLPAGSASTAGCRPSTPQAT